MISIFTLDEAEKWDSIVKSFDNYDVYYLSGYTKAFKLHGDGEPTLFYYEDEKIRAINVVMLRDIYADEHFTDIIDENTRFDISTPYGYGGFLIEGNINNESIKKLDDEYSAYCRSQNIVSEFVRFHPIIENSKNNYDIYEVIDLGKTITMDLHSREQIWDDLSSKGRYNIRKAIKAGVKIYWGRDPELIREFIPLYNKTMTKDEATEYYYFNECFYNSILHDLKHNNLFFYAVYEGKIISITMIIFANHNIHYHLSASDRKYQSLAATNLLLYEAACWGHKNGYKSFHLGGGLGSQEDNLYKFKKSFNKNSETYFSIGKKVFHKENYEKLTNIRRQEEDFNEEKSFFPIYRK